MNQMEKKKSLIQTHRLHNSRQEEVKPSTSWNPYKLKEAKEIFANEDQMISNKSLHSASLDEEINRVTKLFCDWVTSLVSPHYNKQTFIKERMGLY